MFTYANSIEIGGADYCLFKMATSLDKRKFEVHVALGYPSPLEKMYRNAGVMVHYIPMKRIQSTNNPLKLLNYLFSGIYTVAKLRDLITRFQIDLVHSNDLLDFYGPFAGKIAGIKTVQHIRMILPDNKRKRILTFLCLRLSDKIITVSDATATSMFSRNGIIPQIVTTIYDWLDPEVVGQCQYEIPFRDEKPFLKNNLVIGTVGRLQEWKGQHVFLQAAHCLSNDFPNAWFIICGGSIKGRSREQYEIGLKRLALKLGISERVIFTGHRSDVMNVISAFDIFVHSSIAPDPLPGVLMEAGFAGVPVVAPQAGGVPEELIDGETGYLYEPANPAEMASKIRDLMIAEAGYRLEMGQRGKEFVEELFDKNKLVDKMEEMYLSLGI